MKRSAWTLGGRIGLGLAVLCLLTSLARADQRISCNAVNSVTASWEQKGVDATPGNCAEVITAGYNAIFVTIQADGPTVSQAVIEFKGTAASKWGRFPKGDAAVPTINNTGSTNVESRQYHFPPKMYAIRGRILNCDTCANPITILVSYEN